MELRLVDPIRLFRLCAADRENSAAWSEFLRRYSGKITFFIKGTLRQVFGGATDHLDPADSGGVQESDLFQNIIIRLVENDCAVMKKFSGAMENELFAYLAVICRSTVLDSLRRNTAGKRRHVAADPDDPILLSADSHRAADRTAFEREILVSELVSLARQTIRSHSGHLSSRDQLVFDMHFLDGLSSSQIAQCEGINLSKAGIEKLIKRLVGRVQSLASPGKSEETLQ
jgi:RNA polymerase sigma factor (sigma-70 family)